MLTREFVKSQLLIDSGATVVSTVEAFTMPHADATFAAVKSLMESKGFTVVTDDASPYWAEAAKAMPAGTSPDQLGGISSVNHKMILIRENKGRQERTHTLIHESSHMLGGDTGWRPTRADQLAMMIGLPAQAHIEGEVLAELATWMTLDALGVDQTVSQVYLSMFSRSDYLENTADKVDQQWLRAERISQELVSAIRATGLFVPGDGTGVPEVPGSTRAYQEAA
jgi:hypothetical protein